jgi:hypothetical protein
MRAWNYLNEQGEDSARGYSCKYLKIQLSAAFTAPSLYKGVPYEAS